MRKLVASHFWGAILVAAAMIGLWSTPTQASPSQQEKQPCDTFRAQQFAPAAVPISVGPPCQPLTDHLPR